MKSFAKLGQRFISYLNRVSEDELTLNEIKGLCVGSSLILLFGIFGGSEIVTIIGGVLLVGTFASWLELKDEKDGS